VIWRQGTTVKIWFPDDRLWVEDKVDDYFRTDERNKNEVTELARAEIMQAIPDVPHYDCVGNIESPGNASTAQSTIRTTYFSDGDATAKLAPAASGR
jgi:hypothetical protein